MKADNTNAQPFIPLNATNNACMDKWFDDNNVNQYLDRSFMNELQQEGSQLSVAAKVKNGSCPVVGINSKSKESDVDDDANNNANDDDDYSVGELLANDDDDDRRSNDGDSVMSFDSQLSRLSQFTPIPPPMITPTPRTPIPPIVVTHAEENLDGYLPQNYSNDVIDADDLLVHDNDTNSEFSF